MQSEMRSFPDSDVSQVSCSAAGLSGAVSVHIYLNVPINLPTHPTVGRSRRASAIVRMNTLGPSV